MNKIALVGFIGSGKGTASKYLVDHHGYTEYSFASSVKDALSVIFGWERNLLEGDTVESREFREITDVWWSEKLNIPNFTPRLAMTTFATDIMRNKFNKDIWINSLLRKVSRSEKVIISDARFKNEIDNIKKYGFNIVMIERHIPEWYDLALRGDTDALSSKYNVHQSEYDWVGYNIDHVIKNDGRKSSLFKQIDALL